MRILDSINQASLRKDIPQFNVGDTVEVGVRIIEGGKEKLQSFRGIVIARRGKGLNETFIIRKISFGEGVERTFYLHSPKIKSLGVIKKGKVRRAKLYYLRGKIGKKSKVKEFGVVPGATKVAEEGVADKGGEKFDKIDSDSNG